MATSSIIFIVQLDCLEQKMEEGGNLINNTFLSKNKIYKEDFLMKKIVSLVLALSMVLSMFATAFAGTALKDVAETDTS